MSSSSSSATARAPHGRLLLALAVLVWAGTGLFVALSLISDEIPGWDETGHAFAALRMAEALKALDLGQFFVEFQRPDTYTGPGRLWMVPAFLLADTFATPRAATVVVGFAAIALAAGLSRRLVGPERRDAVTLWTVVFAVTSWLGIEYTRIAFQEAWCALWILLGMACWLRVRERGSQAGAWLCGAVLGFALVVKFNYGLYLAGALAVVQAVDGLARPEGVRVARIALGTFGGALLVLLWWFVLPLPMGLEVAAGHREYLLLFLTNNAEHQGAFGPGYLLVVWVLQSCISPLAFAMQLAGLGLGLARWRNPALRIATVLALLGLAAFLASANLRLDRFLVPILPALWMLGAVVAASLAALARRLELVAHLALLMLLLATRGMGQLAVARASGVVATWTPEVEAVIRERVDPWTRPLGQREPRLPAGVDAVLDAARARLDPEQTFLWLGGTRTELPVWLVEWWLFQASGAREIVRRERDAEKRDHWWQELTHEDGQPFSEADFRAFADDYPQVVVLDPPDTRDNPREFEVRYAAWMDRHPGFELEATESVEFEVRPGTLRPIGLRFYRRVAR